MDISDYSHLSKKLLTQLFGFSLSAFYLNNTQVSEFSLIPYEVCLSGKTTCNMGHIDKDTEVTIEIVDNVITLSKYKPICKYDTRKYNYLLETFKLLPFIDTKNNIKHRDFNYVNIGYLYLLCLTFIDDNDKIYKIKDTFTGKFRRDFDIFLKDQEVKVTFGIEFFTITDILSGTSKNYIFDLCKPILIEIDKHKI